MAANNPNLRLDIDSSNDQTTARIVVDWVQGYAPVGDVPAVTTPCASLAEIGREVGRLQKELDGALEEAGPIYGVAGDSEPEETPETSEAPARLVTDLTVGAVMRPEVRTMDPNDPLSVANEIMTEGGFRHVVVVEDDCVVGVISHRDIFHGALAWSMGQGQTGYERALAGVSAKKVMRTHVVTTQPEAPLSAAALRMREEGVGCLPVIAEGKLVGILTDGDFLDLFAP